LSVLMMVLDAFWRSDFSHFFRFLTPQMRGKGWSWKVHWCVGKVIPDFIIFVHWSYFDILTGLLTNRPNIANKRDFSRTWLYYWWFIIQ